MSLNAAHAFQSKLSDVPAASASDDPIADWRKKGEFAACETADVERYFNLFSQTRRAAQNGAGRDLSPEETIADAWEHRNVMSDLSKQEAKERGIAETSIHARMQNAKIGPEYQKTFFEDFVTRAGHEAGPVTDDDEVLFDRWQQLERGTLSEEAFFAPLENQSRDEKVAFAVNLARVVARHHSEKHAPEEDHSIGHLEGNIKFKEKLVKSPLLTSVEEKNHRAELHGMRELYTVETSILAHEAIGKGTEVLEKLLAPPPENEWVQPSERLSWNPCDDWDDVDSVCSTFENACTAYNAQVSARTGELRKQERLLKDSALPLLGMPMELRGNHLAENFRTQTAEAVLAEKGLATPKTIGEKAIWGAKVIGVGLLTAASLGFMWISPRVQNAFGPLFSREMREQIANEHAEKEQIAFLRDRNHALAKDWVIRQYSTPTSGNDAPDSASRNDPHRLLAAIANPLLEGGENDFLAHESLVNDVTNQLYLAAGSDVLTAKEGIASVFNVSTTDPRAQLENQAYLTDQGYLKQIARGIVDGMVEGLHQVTQNDQTRHQPSTVLESITPETEMGTA